MKIKHSGSIRGIILLLFFAMACTPVMKNKPHTIETHKECPLCGMIPARYPLFHCQIVFEDGSYEAFDSAAGLLVYLHFPDKTGFQLKQVANIYFRHYQTEQWIDAQNTWFVVGSEVLGPMGIEFLPVENEQDARRLMDQEQGARIVSFAAVDRTFMLQAAEAGWLHFLARKLVLE